SRGCVEPLHRLPHHLADAALDESVPGDERRRLDAVEVDDAPRPESHRTDLLGAMHEAVHHRLDAGAEGEELVYDARPALRLVGAPLVVAPLLALPAKLLLELGDGDERPAVHLRQLPAPRP